MGPSVPHPLSLLRVAFLSGRWPLPMTEPCACGDPDCQYCGWPEEEEIEDDGLDVEYDRMVDYEILDR